MHEPEKGVQKQLQPAGGTDAEPCPTSPLAVRLAVPEDAYGIAETHVASWRSAYAELLPKSVLDGLSVDRRADQWRREIADENYVVHVAVCGDDLSTKAGTLTAESIPRRRGQIAGFVTTGASRDKDALQGVGELVAIYVRPGAERQGIGALMHGVALSALTVRFDVATLWVLDNNFRARAFYERLGWQYDGSRKAATLRDGTEIIEVRYRRLLSINF